MADEISESGDEEVYSYTLLLECENSKRVVEMQSKIEPLRSRLQEEVQKIVGAEIELVLDVAEYRRKVGAVKPGYLLQRLSSEWNDYVDVIDAIAIGTKDKLKAVPIKATSDTKKEDTASKIESIISKVKKPTKEEAKVLSNLFPSSFSGSRKRPVFDPHDECVAGPSHSKKKKFAKPTQKIAPKLASVEVVALKKFQTRLPKGKERKKLLREGRITKMKLSRGMTAEQVKQRITENFEDLPGFSYLEVEDGYLARSDTDFNGEKAINRRGALYICQTNKDSKSKPSSDQTQKHSPKNVTDYMEVISSDDEFERVVRKKSCLKKAMIDLTESTESGSDSDSVIRRTTQKADDILNILKAQKPATSSFNDDDEDDLPSFDVSSNMKEDILEFRAIRNQQDKEYEETLRADKAKVEERKQIMEEVARKEEIHQSLKSKWQRVMTRLSCSESESDGFKFTIRYPTSRVECCIPQASTSKDLYEVAYAFCPNFNMDAFNLYIMIPRQFVPFTDTRIGDSNFGLSPVFVIEEGTETVPFLSDENICIRSTGASDGYSSILELLAEKTEDFMTTLDVGIQCPHVVNRDRLFDDVIKLYKTKFLEILKQYPFSIAYQNEKAHDTGGVSRDMFSQFWDEAWLKCFDGGNILIPAVNPHTDTALFPVLGTILSHGFLVSNFLPLRIAFPSLAAMLLGPTILIPESILVDTFADYLSTYESAFIHEILVLLKDQQPHVFTNEQTKTLVDILSRMDCREIPNPTNLRRLIVQVAKHEFLTKPLGALYAFNSGVPAIHHPFWNEVTIGELYSWYKALNATPKRVIEKLVENEDMSAAESRVFKFLVTFVGDLNPEELRNFLRYVTGSSVLICERIKVTFNGVSGLGRSPVGHTCDCWLELSTTYYTYPEFKHEFLNILNSAVAWPMDAV